MRRWNARSVYDSPQRQTHTRLLDAGFARRREIVISQKRQNLRRREMKFLFSFALLSAFAFLSITPINTASEAEWPQWRGPLRNGLSSEIGLLKRWPANGPAVIWSVSNLGEGYGSLSIKSDRIYVQG